MVPRRDIEWEFIEWESVAAEEPSLALWSSIRRQTAEPPAHPQWGSSQTLGMWVGINLAASSRVPAAPSGSQRHREDSVDNDPSLWCVLQGPAKAEPGYSNEARASVWSHTGAQIWIHLYCPSRRIFFFFLPSQQFEKISLIILNLILIMEIRDWVGRSTISFLCIYGHRSVQSTCRFTWINEILNKTWVLSLKLH